MSTIEKYKHFLDRRYQSFKLANEEFKKINGKTILELGTTRSFVDGSHVGCMSDDVRYWYPNNPELWDWGAGAFTLVFSEEYKNTDVKIVTVDAINAHIKRCKIMTEKNKNVEYVTNCSLNYLNTLSESSCDFIYQDTCDCDENGCLHHKKEAEIIVSKKILKSGGVILIDDHKNLDTSLTSKTKYSLPVYTQNGFVILYEGQQLLLKKI